MVTRGGVGASCGYLSAKLWVVNRGSFTGWLHLTIKLVLAAFKWIKPLRKKANNHSPVKKVGSTNFHKKKLQLNSKILACFPTSKSPPTPFLQRFRLGLMLIDGCFLCWVHVTVEMWKIPMFATCQIGQLKTYNIIILQSWSCEGLKILCNENTSIKFGFNRLEWCTLTDTRHPRLLGFQPFPYYKMPSPRNPEVIMTWTLSLQQLITETLMCHKYGNKRGWDWCNYTGCFKST